MEPTLSHFGGILLLTALLHRSLHRRSGLRFPARQAGWLAGTVAAIPCRYHLGVVKRLQRWAPVTALSSELVRFDLQALEYPRRAIPSRPEGRGIPYNLMKKAMSASTWWTVRARWI
ncbi:RRXRR domain-containing protein [Crenobacter oryzisoli]|uniref:RRXRR domain-containing protein n=1 Tax=Crenobacter oryzisoli TaxID=3056844 RepID=UPI00338F1FBB